jgi:hypothetical protein
MRNLDTIKIIDKSIKAGLELGKTSNDKLPQVWLCKGILFFIDEIIKEALRKDLSLPPEIIEITSREALGIIKFLGENQCTTESTESCQGQDLTQNSTKKTRKVKPLKESGK